MMNCPGSRVTPKGASVLASQATANTGLPSAAAPAPVPMVSPFLVMTMPHSRGSKSTGTTRRALHRCRRRREVGDRVGELDLPVDDP